MSFILRPRFVPIFLPLLYASQALALAGFIIFHSHYYSLSLADMLLAWDIFLSPSLLPFWLVSALLSAFILAWLGCAGLEVTVSFEGISSAATRGRIVPWQQIQKLNSASRFASSCCWLQCYNSRCRLPVTRRLFELPCFRADGYLDFDIIQAAQLHPSGISSLKSRAIHRRTF